MYGRSASVKKMITLPDGTRVEASEDNKNRIMKKNYSGVGLDPEEVLPEPKDEISKHKYPPPKKNPVFRQKWAKFIDNVVARPNFNPGHLESLEILCDLYVELDEVSIFLRTHGMRYKTRTVAGEVWKHYPEVAMKDKLRAQIQIMTKNLSLFPGKDNSIGSDPKEDEEWA